MKRGDKWDELLTVLFLVLAVAALICFFVARNQPYYLICGGIAILIRITHYIARFFSN